MLRKWTIRLLILIFLIVGARAAHAFLDPKAAYYAMMALQVAGVIGLIILVFVAASYLTVLFCGWMLRHRLQRSYTLLWGWNMLRSQRDVVPVAYRFNRWLDLFLPKHHLVPLSLINLAAGGAIAWGAAQLFLTHESRTLVSIAEMEFLSFLGMAVGLTFTCRGVLGLLRANPISRAIAPLLPFRQRLLATSVVCYALSLFLSLFGSFILLELLPLPFMDAGSTSVVGITGLAIGGCFFLYATACAVSGFFNQYVEEQHTPPLRTRVAVTLPNFISMVGIGIGVWALVVVMSVMSGFEGELRNKIIATNPHVLVQPIGGSGAIADYKTTVDKLRTIPNIRSIDAYVEEDAMVRSPFNSSVNLTLRGIDPFATRAERLAQTLVAGEIAFLAHPERLLSDAARGLAPRPVESALPLPEPISKKGIITMPPIPGGAPRNITGDSKLKKPKTILNVWLAYDKAIRLDLGFGDTFSLSPPGNSAVLRARVQGVFEKADRPGKTPDAYLSIPSTLHADPYTIEDLHNLLEASKSHSSWRARKAGGKEEPLYLVRFTDDDPLLTGHLTNRLVDPTVYPGIVLGSVLAESLNVHIGSLIYVISLDAGVGPLGVRPKEEPLRVAGIFQSGMYEFDLKLAYVAREDAQRFFDIGDTVNRIELELMDPREPGPAVASARLLIPPGSEVRDWQVLNRSLFSALKLEKIAMFIVLGFIILVASFNILSSLAMLIQEKTGEIAILKSMGATNGGVMRSFIALGIFLGTVGAICGSLLGVIVCQGIDRWGIALPQEYYIPSLPVEIHGVEVIAAILAAICVSILATLYPSRTASKLDPVEGLRYE